MLKSPAWYRSTDLRRSRTPWISGRVTLPSVRAGLNSEAEYSKVFQGKTILKEVVGGLILRTLWSCETPLLRYPPRRLPLTLP